MRAKFRAWWKDTGKPLEIIGIIAVLIIAIVLIYLVARFYGTGLDGYTQIQVAHTTGATTRTEIFQPGKTLWDWLQLLIIPVVLAVGGYIFNLTVSRNERAAADKQTKAEQEAATKRDQTEREIALDNQQEAALQQYIDKLSELLLLEKSLRNSQPGDEVRNIARVRTLTVLPRLDANRKRSILLFLYESTLIENGKTIIDLKDANLSFADLSFANLNVANLSFADLRSVDLSDADLSFADLSYANLSFADLSDANLSDADLRSVNLRGADLSGANLRSADLSFADLDGAQVTTSQLNTARSLQNTTMPDRPIYL